MERRVGIMDRVKGLFRNRANSQESKKLDSEKPAGAVIIVLNEPEEKYVAYINDSFQNGVTTFGLVGATDVYFDKAKKFFE